MKPFIKNFIGRSDGAVSKNFVRRLLYALKLSVTCGLIAVILVNVQWDGIVSALHQTKIEWLLIVLTAMFLNVLVSTYKWQLLLRIHDIRIPFKQLAKYYFSGTFFNNFLPSTIGGDGYRIYRTVSDSGVTKEPIIVVLMERITGLLALVLLGFIGGAVAYGRAGDYFSQLAMVLGLVICVSAVLVYIMAVRHAVLVKRWSRKYLPEKFRDLLSLLKEYRHRRRETIKVVVLSLGFQAFLLSYRLLMIYAVGEYISIFELAIVTTLSTLVALLPISVNGYGLLDGTMIYLFGYYGLDYEGAVVAMILIRALNIPLSLVGGITYLCDRKPLEAEKTKLPSI